MNTLSLSKVITDSFQVITWIKSYEKKFFPLDLISGLTISIMHLAQGIAYAAILGTLSPITGLYSSFYPALIYAIFGTSDHLSVGSFAIVCIIFGQKVEQLHPMPEHANITTRASVYELRNSEASAIAFISGVTLLILYVLRAGFILKYLPKPSMSGFICGAAIHVFTSQIRSLFGLSIPRISGPGYLPLTYVNLAKAFFSINYDNWKKVLISGLISTLLIVFLNIIRDLNERFKKKYFRGMVRYKYKCQIKMFSLKK